MAKKITRDQADDICDALRSATSSLKSCHKHEVENEARILRNAIKRVSDIVMVRYSKRIEDRQTNLTNEAYRVLRQREG